ncbi:LemA family protein [Pseudomonadota bacterium]
MTILLLVGLAIAAYVITTYNFFQTARTRIKASIQEIGNQLKRQASLIPNLESSVKGYLKQEKDVFKMLTDARKQVTKAADSGDMKQIDKAAEQLQALIPRLQIAVEDNPEIKSDKVVSKMMDELRDTSDKLMYARRTVIDLAADYNIKRVTFPSNFVANMFGFKEEKGIDTPMSGSHVSVSDAETKDVKINL